MQKWQIVYVLPLECWLEIFAFLVSHWFDRYKLGKIVDKIGNYQFAEYLQCFLHDWGKRTFGRFEFHPGDRHRYEKNGFGTMFFYTDIPRTPLPVNIKSFEYIRIDHFGAHALDFLRQLRPLLTDLRISLDDVSTYGSGLADLRTILTNVAPLLFGGTHTLWCNPDVLAELVSYFGAELANLKVLQILFWNPREEYEQQVIARAVNWLTGRNSPEKCCNTNNGPRLCQIYFWHNKSIEQTSTAVRQQFLAATTRCSFALNMYPKPGWALKQFSVQFSEFHLVNGIGEELHGRWIEIVHGGGRWVEIEKAFQITRHQPNCGAQLQEWIGANTKDRRFYRHIKFASPSVGFSTSLDAAAHLDVPAPGDAENEQADQQQPCSSKDA